MVVHLAASAAAILLALFGPEKAARAATSLIVLVPPEAPDRRVAETVHRTSGELAADRLDVVVRSDLSDADPPTALVGAGRETGAAVVVGLWIDALDASAADLWLVHATTSSTEPTRAVVHRHAAGGVASDPPEVIARRMADVVRAALYEDLLATARASAPGLAPPVTPRPRPRPATASALFPRVAVEYGVTGLGSLDRAGLAVLPVLRARVAIAPAWQLRCTGAWLGTRPRVMASGGGASATIDQGVGLLEAVAVLGVGHAVHGTASLGAGAYAVAVDGSASPPYSMQHADDVAFAIDAGTGLAWRPSNHFELSLELHALLSDPGARVRVGGEDVATLGRPSLSALFTLVEWI